MLKNITASGSGYDFDSDAFTENGLTSVDEGGEISCVGKTTVSMILHFSG